MAEKYPERIIVRLTKQQATTLKEEATKHNKTISQMLRIIIENIESL